MTIKFLSLAVAAGLAMSAPAANAALYNFTQTGFEGGASISGSFEASDLTANGIIEGSIFSNFNEITAFTLSFSGNSIASAFTHTFSDLGVLNYKLAKSTIGDANPEGIATNWFGEASGTGFTYVSGVAIAGEQGGTVFNWVTGGQTHTDNLISVTPAAVPVPGALWLFGSALAGFIGAARRKNS